MQYDVVTIGSATRDVFVQTDRFQMIETGSFQEGRAECLPAGAKIEVDEMTFTIGGGGTNAAVTFARQELQTAAIVRVGDDAQGKEVRQAMEEEGVATDYMQADAERATGYSLLLLSSDGERTVLVHRGASEHIDVDAVPWDAIETQWFHVTSLGGNMALLERIVAVAEERDTQVFLNPGSRELQERDRLLDVLETVDVLNLNLDEAAMLAGVDRDNKDQVFRSLWDITQGIVVVTDGPNGVDVYDGEHVHHGGIFQEERLADRTGAGDAFGSGFVAGLIQKHSATEGIRIGTANATSVVEHIGAKEGILRKKDLVAERWQGLSISEEPLNAS